MLQFQDILQNMKMVESMHGTMEQHHSQQLDLKPHRVGAMLD